LNNKRSFDLIGAFKERMKRYLQHQMNWLTRMIFILVGFFVFQISGLVFSPHIEISFDVETCEFYSELNDDFCNQITGCGFSDLHSLYRWVSESENVHIEGVERKAAKGSGRVFWSGGSQVQVKLRSNLQGLME